jgi:catechol 2,3-dioxygenase-like lactoylglutathione lyase family enzyme
MNIEHIALNVPDPVPMADWYTRHLGMRVVRSLAVPPHTRFLADASGRVVLEIYRQEKVAPPDYSAQDPLVLHVAFLTADVREAQQRLLAAGATTAGDITATPSGDELAMLRDPWGVPIQLVKRAQALIS